MSDAIKSQSTPGASPDPDGQPSENGVRSTAAEQRQAGRPSLRPLALVFALVTTGTLMVEHGGRALGLESYTHVSLAALFLVVAVQAAQRTPAGLAGHGLWLGGLLEPPQEPSAGVFGGIVDLASALMNAVPSALRETGVALATAALTFPPFVVGFYLYHQPHHPFSFQSVPAPLDTLLSQLLVVALPEEALFRGYIQSHLVGRFPARGRWPVAALLLQAGLFAILHFVVNLDPARLAVFFPALLFGLLREVRGGIGAALVYHALCNLLGDLLVRGFL